jgi:putative glycosyltransferase (TIGR04372 family)
MSINSFVACQISQVRDGGWDVVKGKTGRLLTKIIWMPLYLIAVPLVLFARIMRPFIQIRFGPIRNDVIGQRDVDQSKTLDYFYFKCPESPNEQWEIMVKRAMKTHPIIKYCDYVNHILLGWKHHYACLQNTGSRDTQGIFFRTPSHIRFTKEENERGRKFLEQVGMKPNQHFVCMIARDSAYKEKYMHRWGNRDWSYHNYRDSNINNYSKTAHTLAQHNYFVFRLGKGVNESLEIENNNVIDYATSEYRNDFLDIFLSGQCRFFINGESGLNSVPMAFRVPIVFVNLSAIEYALSWNENTISISKKYWLKEKKRFMTFKEIFESGAGRFLRTDQYEKLGIELIENTPDEILDVSMEMLQRINGTWETTEEDEVLQKRFWDMFPESELHGEFRARIGAKFLRQNSALLD